VGRQLGIRKSQGGKGGGSTQAATVIHAHRSREMRTGASRRTPIRGHSHVTYHRGRAGTGLAVGVQTTQLRSESQALDS